jgi:hypothetical protein
MDNINLNYNKVIDIRNPNITKIIHVNGSNTNNKYQNRDCKLHIYDLSIYPLLNPEHSYTIYKNINKNLLINFFGDILKIILNELYTGFTMKEFDASNVNYNGDSMIYTSDEKLHIHCIYNSNNDDNYITFVNKFSVHSHCKLYFKYNNRITPYLNHSETLHAFIGNINLINVDSIYNKIVDYSNNLVEIHKFNIKADKLTLFKRSQRLALKRVENAENVKYGLNCYNINNYIILLNSLLKSYLYNQKLNEDYVNFIPIKPFYINDYNLVLSDRFNSANATQEQNKLIDLLYKIILFPRLVYLLS